MFNGLQRHCVPGSRERDSWRHQRHERSLLQLTRLSTRSVTNKLNEIIRRFRFLETIKRKIITITYYAVFSTALRYSKHEASVLIYYRLLWYRFVGEWDYKADNLELKLLIVKLLGILSLHAVFLSFFLSSTTEIWKIIINY